jgi:hypothetical protein
MFSNSWYRPMHVCISWIYNTLPSYFRTIRFNITSHTRLGLPDGLFPLKFSNQNSVRILVSVSNAPPNSTRLMEYKPRYSSLGNFPQPSHFAFLNPYKCFQHQILERFQTSLHMLFSQSWLWVLPTRRRRHVARDKFPGVSEENTAAIFKIIE